MDRFVPGCFDIIGINPFTHTPQRSIGANPCPVLAGILLGCQPHYNVPDTGISQQWLFVEVLGVRRFGQQDIWWRCFNMSSHPNAYRPSLIIYSVAWFMGHYSPWAVLDLNMGRFRHIESLWAFLVHRRFGTVPSGLSGVTGWGEIWASRLIRASLTAASFLSNISSNCTFSTKTYRQWKHNE